MQVSLAELQDASRLTIKCLWLVCELSGQPAKDEFRQLGPQADIERLYALQAAIDEASPIIEACERFLNPDDIERLAPPPLDLPGEFFLPEVKEHPLIERQNMHAAVLSVARLFIDSVIKPFVASPMTFDSEPLEGMDFDGLGECYLGYQKNAAAFPRWRQASAIEDRLKIERTRAERAIETATPRARPRPAKRGARPKKETAQRIAFYEKHQDMEWSDVATAYRKQYPDDQVDAPTFKKTCERARRNGT